MSEKYCDEHDEEFGSFRKKLCAFLGVLVLLILITIFLIWVILRPSKPRVVLQDATIYSFSLSSSLTGPNFLNATIQVTIACRNSNDRIGILYERAEVVALYKHQQITLPTALPTGYQSPNDDVIWSPFLFSVNSPMAPYLAAQLQQEQAMQLVRLQIKLNGRIKWKVGAWMSGIYHLYVNCPALIAFGSGRSGVVVGEAMKVELASGCDVDVGLGG
uniref:Late embryogenesis abundant protein LEA-2 subgroup domain-containing protein n=1 Tax=Kalanchoe fedtschenkoi TaxID=63787 RepID=A0A7N1A5Z2_KALFE